MLYKWTIRPVLSDQVTILEFPAEKYGLHSIRSGGATAAANVKVPDHIFKRHG